MSENKSIVFELTNSSSEAESIISYLERFNHHISPSEKISQAVFEEYLPFAISKDHEFYRELVLRALAHYSSQISLLEQLSGISLRKSKPTNVNHSTTNL